MLHSFSNTCAVLAIFLSLFDFSASLPHPAAHQIGSRHLGKRGTTDEYVAYAAAGIDQLQTWYDAATGLWGNAWWNSANVLTMLADFQACFPDKAKATTDLVFPTTLSQAQNTFKGFINGFYDDELWWVLAWIRVYDVTNDEKYLDVAAEIFEDSKKAWGQTPCGGLWWDKAHTSIGAVENELYMTAAAKLAVRRPSTPRPGYYWEQAVEAYEWLVNSKLIQSNDLITNGLDIKTCQPNGFVMTYNQGILLSGLAEMTWVTGDQKYNNLAVRVANATIATQTDSNGILHEKICEANGCDTDLQQFKGIFGRNIQFLHERAMGLAQKTKDMYRNFLMKNADSIWAFDQADNQLGLIWSGPYQMATVMTQSSALDAIVGAACVSS